MNRRSVLHTDELALTTCSFCNIQTVSTLHATHTTCTVTCLECPAAYYYIYYAKKENEWKWSVLFSWYGAFIIEPTPAPIDVEVHENTRFEKIAALRSLTNSHAAVATSRNAAYVTPVVWTRPILDTAAEWNWSSVRRRSLWADTSQHAVTSCRT